MTSNSKDTVYRADGKEILNPLKKYKKGYNIVRKITRAL